MNDKDLLMERIKKENETTKLKNAADVQVALNILNLDDEKLVKLLLSKKNIFKYLDKRINELHNIFLVK